MKNETSWIYVKAVAAGVVVTIVVHLIWTRLVKQQTGTSVPQPKEEREYREGGSHP